MDPVAALASAALFRGLTRAQCASFAAIAQPRRVSEHEYLFRLGERATRLLVIRNGLVELTMPLEMNGQEHDVVVETAGEGETVAWSALIEPYRFTLSGRTGTEVELLAFTRPDLQAALVRDPQAGLQVMTNVARLIGRRLQVVQAMWSRGLQRAVSDRFGYAIHEEGT
jgi:CRP-like cAMP-binding protein